MEPDGMVLGFFDRDALKRSGGGAGRPTYPDRAEHAAAVRDHAMVAFASDPELTEFLRRLDAYRTGPRRDERGTERSAPYEALFDAIVRPRPLEVTDVLSPALRSHLASLEHPDDSVKIDVQCWCPEDEAEARRRREDFLRAVDTAGGRLIAGDFRPRVGLSLLRVEVAAGAVTDLACTDRARSIDLLPQLPVKAVDNRPLSAFPQLCGDLPGEKQYRDQDLVMDRRVAAARRA